MSALVANVPDLIRAAAPTGREFLRVPGKWLDACGHGINDRVFPVISVLSHSDWLTFATVNHEGRTWVVHVPCRNATFVSTAAHFDALYRLQEFCMSHGMDAEVDTDEGAVFVDVVSTDTKGTRYAERVRVTTLGEARAVLGY